jgi:Putative MetA-pathway of phenol degradation
MNVEMKRLSGYRRKARMAVPVGTYDPWLVGYYCQQLTPDRGQPPILGDFKSRVAAVGPQIGFLFPIGDAQGYVNLKAYSEFDAENRPAGLNAWLTFAISPKAPEAPVPRSARPPLGH